MTIKNIEHLIKLGYKDQILVFDNGSHPSFKQSALGLGIQYHREFQNCYVNPAWNKIFERNESDFLTLLNNDCFILSPKYFEEILPHMHDHNIGISSCRTKNIDQLKNDNFKYSDYFWGQSRSLKYFKEARRQGWLMTLDMETFRKLDYQIPEYLRLWYGDDWIWGQFRKNNIKTAVYKNRYAVHIKNSTIATEAFRTIIDADIKNLDQFGHWHKRISPRLHQRTRIFHRYA